MHVHMHIVIMFTKMPYYLTVPPPVVVMTTRGGLVGYETG